MTQTEAPRADVYTRVTDRSKEETAIAALEAEFRGA